MRTKITKTPQSYIIDGNLIPLNLYKYPTTGVLIKAVSQKIYSSSWLLPKYNKFERSVFGSIQYTVCIIWNACPIGDVVRTVALYYPGSSLLDFECPGCEPLQWQGGQVPIAKRVFKLRVVSIEPAAFLAMSSLAVVGITLALAFLVFNLHFRKLK